MFSLSASFLLLPYFLSHNFLMFDLLSSIVEIGSYYIKSSHWLFGISFQLWYFQKSSEHIHFKLFKFLLLSYSKIHGKFTELIENIVLTVSIEILAIDDLNARNGCTGDSVVMSTYGKDNIIDCGGKLVNFSKQFNLSILNDFNKHKEIHLRSANLQT